MGSNFIYLIRQIFINVFTFFDTFSFAIFSIIALIFIVGIIYGSIFK